MIWNSEAREKSLDLQVSQAQLFPNKQQPALQHSIEEAHAVWSQIFCSCFWDQVNAHARSLDHVNHGVLYDGIGQTFHDLIPPGIMSCWVLKSNEVGGQGSTDLNQRRQS